METIGINQGAGGGENYPLIEPSNDIKGLIADLNLSFKRIKTAKVRILSLHNFQTVISEDGRADVVLGDEDGNSLWDTANAQEYEHHLWGDAYHIFSWRTHDSQLMMVVRDAYLRSITIDITPVSADIDPRAVSCLAPHIYSIELTDRYGTTHHIKNKKLIIESGYNIELISDKANGLREAATVTIGAKAGAGKGRAPLSFIGVIPDEDGLLLKYLNGVTPDEKGRISFIGDDGYSLELKQDDLHSIYLRNTDVPCCDCNLLSDLGDYIAEVAGEYSAIGANAEGVRSDLEKLIKELEKLKEKFPGISIASATLQGVSAACHRFTIRVDITNKMPYPADISLDLNFTPLAIRTETYSSSQGISETVVYRECEEYVTTSTNGTASIPVSNSINQYGDGQEHYSKIWSNVPPGSSVAVQLSGTKKSRGDATVSASGTISGNDSIVGLAFYPSSSIIIKSPCTSSPNELFDVSDPSYDETLLNDYYNYIWNLRDSEYFKTDRTSEVVEKDCNDDASNSSSDNYIPY